MKQKLYGTTAMAAVGLLMVALAGCEQAPRDPNAPPEEPIKLDLGGFLGSSFAFGETLDEE